MSKKLYSYELIEALSSAFGPSGCEERVVELIREQTDDLGITPTLDKIGNLIFEVRSNK